MLVEFCEEKKIAPKIVFAATDFIAKRIATYMRLEVKEAHDGNETVH